MIFFFILLTYLLDIVLILLGEILSWSLVGVRGLRLPYQSPIIITEYFWSNDNYNIGNDKDNKNDNNNINDNNNNNNNNNSENQKYKIQECD